MSFDAHEEKIRKILLFLNLIQVMVTEYVISSRYRLYTMFQIAVTRYIFLLERCFMQPILII